MRSWDWRLNLRFMKREHNPEIFRYDSMEGFSAHNCFGLRKKVDHGPHLRSFQGNSDPLGIYAEFSVHFLITYISSYFCIGLLEACLLGYWVTVSSWAFDTKDRTWIYGFWLAGETSSGKFGSKECLAFIVLLTFEYNPQDMSEIALFVCISWPKF